MLDLKYVVENREAVLAMLASRGQGLAGVQAFLNSQWRSESDGVQWFDPDRDSLYPDRIRRRPRRR